MFLPPVRICVAWFVSKRSATTGITIFDHGAFRLMPKKAGPVTRRVRFQQEYLAETDTDGTFSIGALKRSEPSRRQARQ